MLVYMIYSINVPLRQIHQLL